MSRAFLSVTCLLALCLAGCGREIGGTSGSSPNNPRDVPAYDPARPIVGRWEYVSGDVGFGGFQRYTEFTADGKHLRKEGDQWRQLGTYTFDGATLTVTGEGGITAMYKIASVTEEKLVSTDPKGELKRLK